LVEATLSDVKEELTQADSIDNSSVSSFKGFNIKELRSRFENNESMSVGSNKNPIKRRELLATKSSIESDIDENECHADGDDNSLDTKKVLLYAKKIEQRANEGISVQDSHPEVSKTEEAGSGETENSSKENILDQTADDMFPNFSPVAIRKKAFEMRKQQKLRAATPKNDEGSLQQNAVLVSQSSNVIAVQPGVQPVSSMAQSTTPRLSVKERVASFNSPGVCNQSIPQANSYRQVVPFQKRTPPPGAIQMSYTNQTPSPLWTNSQHDGSMFSPMESFSSPIAQQRQLAPSLMAPSSTSNQQYQNRSISQQGYRNAQIKTVQTSYDCDDDDYDDGITLSPTCSEVSGLTLPTCLGSVAEDKPKSSNENAPDHQECMSPIARHRQKQGPNSNGTLFNHPYLKRMMSNVSTPKASGQQQASAAQSNRPSHREQIISRVIEKPSTPRRANKKPPTPSNRKPIKKSVSNQSTLTTVSSNVDELQPPQRKQPQRTISNQSTMTTVSSNAEQSHQHKSQRNAHKKGTVAERVAMVERSSRQSEGTNNQHLKKIASRGAQEAKARYSGRTNDEQSSTATRDCVRLI
jgi:hypothetical protein